MTAVTAVLASLALVSAALPLKPELEIRRPDPNAWYAKPGYKAATEAQYVALKGYLDAEGVAYREIGPNETPQSRFVLNVNEKGVQEMHVTEAIYE